MTFGKVIFDRELTFGKVKLKNYSSKNLQFLLPHPHLLRKSHIKKLDFRSKSAKK